MQFAIPIEIEISNPKPFKFIKTRNKDITKAFKTRLFLSSLRM
jgi:hypothetical protein